MGRHREKTLLSSKRGVTRLCQHLPPESPVCGLPSGGQQRVQTQ